jgi:hypothetical protein
MSDEMLLESALLESEESDESESDEAFVESEDSAEDLGEARSSRGSRRPRSVNRYLPVRSGVSGMRLRGPDGRMRNLQFPAKLATAAETNRGLASQEVGRRALAQRLDKLESGMRLQDKKGSAISGTVYLGIGGGLTAWSLFKASQRASGTPFSTAWADEPSATMATLASATQLATSGAKWLINGHYHRSGLGIAADLFSLVQIGGFAFASLYKPAQRVAHKKVNDQAARIRAAAALDAKAGELIAQEDTGEVFELRAIAAGGLAAVRI